MSLLVVTVFFVGELGSLRLLNSRWSLFGALIHVFIIDGLFVFHRLVLIIGVGRLVDLLLIELL